MEYEDLLTRLKQWASQPSHADKGLEEQSRALAQYLLTQDTAPIRPGDRVVLAYLPSLDFMVAFFACLRAGIISVPVYPPNPRNLHSDLKRFNRIVTLSGAVAVLTHNKYNRLKRIGSIAHSAKSVLSSKPLTKWPDLPWLLTDRSAMSRSSTDRSFRLDDSADPNAIAFLQFTSGTTTAPKGLMVTHGNLAHNTGSASTHMKITESSVCVSWLPCFHDLGLIGAALALFYVGGTTVFMSPFDFVVNPASWIDRLDSFRGTHIEGPNFSFILAARKWLARNKSVLDKDGHPKVDLSCVDHIINGAEPITGKVLDAFQDLFAPAGLSRSAVAPGYGIADNSVYTLQGGRLRVRVERSALELGVSGMRNQGDDHLLDYLLLSVPSGEPDSQPLGVARIRQWYRHCPLFVTEGYHRTDAFLAERDHSGASGEAEDDDGVEDMQWHWWGPKPDDEFEQPPAHCPLQYQEFIGCGPVTRDDGMTFAIVDPETRHAWYRSDRPPPEGPCVKRDAVPIGEIWIRSPSVTAGYWNMPELTEQIFHATLREESEDGEAHFATTSHDGEGESSLSVPPSDTEPMYWLRTEDMGFVWGGELFFAGRLKEWMTIGGRHYYPYDIEQTADSVLAPQRTPDPSLPATVREGLLQGVLREGCSAALAVPLSVVHRVLQVMQRKLPKSNNTAPPASVSSSDTSAEQNVLVLISEYRTELLTQPTKEARAEQRRMDAIRIARAILIGHGILPAMIMFLHKRKIRKTTSGKLAHFLNAEALHMLANGDPRGPWQPRNKSIHLAFPVSPETLQVPVEREGLKTVPTPAQRASLSTHTWQDDNDMLRYMEGETLARALQWELGTLLCIKGTRIPMLSTIPRLGLDVREYEQFKTTLSFSYGLVRITDSILLNSECSLKWLVSNARQLRNKQGLIPLPDGDSEQLNILTVSSPQRGLDQDVQYLSGNDSNPSGSANGHESESDTESDESEDEAARMCESESSMPRRRPSRLLDQASGGGGGAGRHPERSPRRSSGYLAKRGGGSGFFSSTAWKKRFIVIEDGHMRYWADENEFDRGRKSLKDNVVDVSKYRVEAVAESADPFLIVLTPTHDVRRIPSNVASFSLLDMICESCLGVKTGNSGGVRVTMQPSLRSWELRTENEEERAEWVRIFREQGAEGDVALTPTMRRKRSGP